MQSPDTDMTEKLISLTSDIVAAHVSNNSVGVDDLPNLIRKVHEALSDLGGQGAQDEPTPEPAVAIRSSVRKNAITCLDCGRKMKMLKRHLMTEHGLTTDDYRQRWGLPSDYPMVAPAYAETRRTLAKKIGLGRKPGQKVQKKTVQKKKTARKGATAKKTGSRKPTAKK